MWKLMLILTMIGYFLLFVYVLACCIIVCNVAFGRRDLRRSFGNRIVDRMPYVNTIENLIKKKYEEIPQEDRGMECCAICLMDY